MLSEQLYYMKLKNNFLLNKTIYIERITRWKN